MALNAIDSFFTKAKDSEGRVELFLSNGKRFSGVITEFDATSVMLHTKKGRKNLVLRQGIVSCRALQASNDGDDKDDKHDKDDGTDDQNE